MLLTLIFNRSGYCGKELDRKQRQDFDCQLVAQERVTTEIQQLTIFRSRASRPRGLNQQ